MLMLGTLHDRVGETRNVYRKNKPNMTTQTFCLTSSLRCVEMKGAEQSFSHEGFLDGGWGRVIGRSGEHASSNFFKNGAAYDYDFGATQTGLDLYGREDASGNWDKFGLYVGYGHGKSHVKGVYVGSAGHVDMDMYSLGAYYTHMAASGWYTDTIIQASWYDANATSTASQVLTPNGFGILASFETGYAFRLSNGVSLEPQAQLVYQRVSFDNVSDAYGRFYFDDASSFRGRFGMRVVKNWFEDEEGRPEVFSIWLRSNIWHEFNNDNGLNVTDLYGLNGVSFSSMQKGTWGEIEAGIAGRLTDHVNLFASTSYSHSLDGKDYSDWGGQVGFTINW